MRWGQAIGVRSRQTLRVAKLLVGDQRLLLPLFLRLTPEGTERDISDATDIVVEGFPRSGTTFTAYAFADARPGGTRVTNHVHNIAILDKAVIRQVPTLVVVRKPVDCLASYLVWAPEIGTKVVWWEWLHYHRRLADRRGDVVIASFEAATTNLAGVMDMVNAKFGTDFRLTLDKNQRRRIEERIRVRHRELHPSRADAKGVPVPDSGRDRQLAHWRAQLQSEESAHYRAEAESLYQFLVASADIDY